MNSIYIILAFLAGAVVAALAAVLVTRSIIKSKEQVLSSQLEASQKEIENQKEAFQREILGLKEASEQALESQKEASEKALESQKENSKRELENQILNAEKSLKEQQERFDLMLEKVTAQMKGATEQMLKERQKEFAESSSQDLGQIVNPLKESIVQMQKAMNDSNLLQTQISTEMKAGIESVMKQSESARQSADELARALKHDTKVQGDWGETILDELLQSQGLTRGIHYDIQDTMTDAQGHSIRTEDNSRLRPDVVLHLDPVKEVIIDSKVSLTAFIDYVNAPDETCRQLKLKEHVDSLWKHVKELSQKNYSNYVKPPKISMDYVIMFVPNTAALWTALKQEPDMWRRAMELNVFIADEQTLFAALRIINLTWTQVLQNQNHEKVYALANEMLDRVGQFAKRYQELGRALEKVQHEYEDCGRKIADNGQSIIVTAKKLEKLGARQSDRNPLPELPE